MAQPLCDELGELLGPLILELQENDIHEADFCRLLDHFCSKSASSFPGHFPSSYAPNHTHFPLSVCLGDPWCFACPKFLDQDAIHRSAVCAFAAKVRPSGRSIFCGLCCRRESVMQRRPSGLPYDRLHVRADSVRKDMLQVLRSLKVEEKACPVNNHLEGHAPTTVAEIQHELFSTDSLVMLD